MKKPIRKYLTDIVLCPKYKKRYQMEAVSFYGESNGSAPNKIVTKFICPACGDFHTIDAQYE